MYAIVKTGGKTEVKIEVGQSVYVEKIKQKRDKVTLKMCCRLE